MRLGRVLKGVFLVVVLSAPYVLLVFCLLFYDCSVSRGIGVSIILVLLFIVLAVLLVFMTAYALSKAFFNKVV